MRLGSSRAFLLLAAAALAAPAFAQQPGPAVDPVPPRPAEPSRPVPGTAPGAAPATAAPAASEAAVQAAEAEAPEDAERAAVCKAHALERLKARSPSVADIFIDMDGLTIAKADLTVGHAHVTAVLMGEAYIQRDRSDKAHRFLCLVGEEDKVLMTFFTEQ